jgi:hypothetical protein
MKRISATGAKTIGTASLLLLTFLLLPAALLFATGKFQDSGQALGGDTSYDVALADLDGDGDLDAFSANGLGNRVWINQGGAQGGSAAVFQNSGGSPGLLTSHGVALADLDGNKTIDAFVANNGENETWLNDGSAGFTLKQQIFKGTVDSQDVALALLDEDNFPDAFIANNGANEVWFNDGDGTFSAAQDDLGSAISHEVVLGDVNNDGAIDAYVANGATSSLADELWINNGQGQFTASNQDLDLDWNEGAALGDLDRDGDLDVFLATWFGSDSVWINQGGLQGGQTGQFKDSGQALSNSGSTDVSLVDVDGDNQLDAIVAKFTGTSSEVWLNNGEGQFSNSGQELDDAATYQIAAGDLDLDGDSDLFLANFGPNHVWLMSGFGLPKAWFHVDARSNPNGLTVYPWAQPGNAKLPVVLDFAAPEDLIVKVQIESDTEIETKSVPFDAGTMSAQLTVENPSPLLTDTLTLTLSTDATLSNGDGWFSSLARGDSTDVKVNPLDLLFINEQEGPTGCFLCMLDWVLKLAGFEPSFWQLHHVQLADLRDSISWSYFTRLFQAHDSELTTIMLANPGLLWETFDVLQVWTPGIVAADAGQGDTIIITQAQARKADDVLKDIADAASAQLKEAIDYEAQILDFPSQGGKDMNQVLEKLKLRIKGQIYLPAILKD